MNTGELPGEHHADFAAGLGPAEGPPPGTRGELTERP